MVSHSPELVAAIRIVRLPPCFSLVEWDAVICFNDAASLIMIRRPIVFQPHTSLIWILHLHDA
jgi:hypothetical protein